MRFKRGVLRVLCASQVYRPGFFARYSLHFDEFTEEKICRRPIGDPQVSSGDIVAVIGHLAWPSVVLSVVWLLRTEIRRALARLESAKLPGGTQFTLLPNESPEAQFDGATRVERNDDVALPDSASTRVGNIYWLGHDLMWTIDVILRNGSKRFIEHGLKQSLHHLDKVGLSTSPFSAAMGEVFRKSREAGESHWDNEHRRVVAADLMEYRDWIGALVASEQSDFVSK